MAEPGEGPGGRPREPAAAPPAPDAASRAVVPILALGALAVVLAGVESSLFDLERHLAPKALALHLTALALIVAGAARPRGLRDAPGLLLAAAVGWAGLSVLLAANRWLALQSWGISFSALVVFAAARPLAGARRWRALGWVAAAVALGAALGVAQAYGAPWPWLASSRPPGGTFGNRNFLAHVGAIGAPTLLVLALRARRVRAALPAVAGLAVVAAAVVLTRSRAAWLAGSAGIAVTALAIALSRRRGARSRGRRVAAGAAAVAVGVAAAILLPNELEWTTEAPYAATLTRVAEFREGSGRGRLIQYRTSLRLVPDRPVLGVGPGNWFVHYPRVTGPGDPAWSGHLPIPTNPWPSSDWVAFVVERGPLGALLLALAGVAAVLRAWRAGRRGEEPDAWGAPALAGTLTAAVVAGAFDAVLLLAAPSLIVATVAGALLPPVVPAGSPAADPSGGGAEGSAPPPARARRGPRVAAGALAAVLVAVAALETAAIVQTRERRDADTLERAARLAPWEHRLHLLLADAGRCEHARRAAELMPHHSRTQALADGC